MDGGNASLSSTQGPQVDCTLAEPSWAGWAAVLQVVGQLGLAPDCGSGYSILGVLFSRRIPGANESGLHLRPLLSNVRAFHWAKEVAGPGPK